MARSNTAKLAKTAAKKNGAQVKQQEAAAPVVAAPRKAERIQKKKVSKLSKKKDCSKQACCAKPVAVPAPAEKEGDDFLNIESFINAQEGPEESDTEMVRLTVYLTLRCLSKISQREMNP
jgi:hypothetical protein